MRVRTDFERVSLSTGEKTRYIVGEGERIEEKVNLQLGSSLYWQMRPPHECGKRTKPKPRLDEIERW